MNTNPAVAITHIKALHVPPEKEIECEINKIRVLIKTIMAEPFKLGNNDIESGAGANSIIEGTVN
jgi:hypothetical protein